MALAYWGLAGPEWVATYGIPGWIGLILLFYGHRWLLRRFGRLSPARLAFIWGLATAAVWGGVVVYLGLEPDLDDPLNWLALAIVSGVLLWCVLFLALGSWSVLGARSAASVLAAGLVAPLICAWVIGMLLIVNGLASSELVRTEEEERYDSGPRSVSWRRPLPGIGLPAKPPVCPQTTRSTEWRSFYSRRSSSSGCGSSSAWSSSSSASP